MNNLIPFIKAHGNGNDVILLIKEKCPDFITRPEFIQNICKRRTGIGSDCVIILSKNSKYDFKMDYYNADGTWETFCANGARCAVKYLYQKEIIGKESNFLSGDGEHKAIIQNDNISIRMNKPKFKSEKLEVNNFQGYVIDSGAKHFCINLDKIMINNNLEKIGMEIRQSDIFMPKGINVNFFQILDNQTLKVYTYEKGVEKLMLSCGSGSAACAFFASKKYEMLNPIKTISEGGNLVISFNDDWSDVWIQGNSIILFESHINFEFKNNY